jgi:Ala-tRNA(Pro) deacylase
VDCKERLESYLRENEVSYQSQHHARAVTAQEVAAAEHVPGKMFAKTVMILANEQKMVMLVLPAPYHVNPEKAARALGVRDVRLADEERFKDVFPDCEVGAMPPFGNLYDVEVCADKTLSEDETIVFRAGTHTDTMSVEYADFEKLVGPTVTEFADPREGTPEILEYRDTRRHRMRTLRRGRPVGAGRGGQGKGLGLEGPEKKAAGHLCLKGDATLSHVP